MKKVIKIYNSKNTAQFDDEIEYWKSILPEEKLSILQELREQYIYLFNKQELYNESRKGLRRFYQIVKLSQS